jgi:aspartyl-tRNA(Asn)/glutamyl-tRNA(Gln) amidotransferase subunit A
MIDLAFSPATELVALFRARKASPVEALNAVLAQLERHEGSLNAFVLVDRDGARRQAAASAERWHAGSPLGLLDGVPVTIKDLVDVAHWPTRRGSTLTPATPAAADAPATARLREAGAVILGKTTTPEFGWKGLGDSPLTGITRNPWSLAHSPGGSSAGAAAALAAGMGALAVGTDGGGSIRIPCAFTGLPGIKATFGRVPAWPLSPMGLLANIGPMARTVDDLALMLTVIGGRDARDPYALPAAGDWRQGIEDGIEGVRIAFSPTLGFAKVDPEVAALVAAAARIAGECGALVEEADPGFADPVEAFNTLWRSGAARALGGLSAEQRRALDPGLAEIIATGSRFSAVQYLEADGVRSQLGHHMAAFHERWDLLLTPAMPVTALPLEREGNDFDWPTWTPFTYPFNMTRQPAAVVPCGLTRAGLPAAIQIVGPLYADALVLRAARAIERAYPFRRPPLEPRRANL